MRYRIISIFLPHLIGASVKDHHCMAEIQNPNRYLTNKPVATGGASEGIGRAAGAGTTATGRDTGLSSLPYPDTIPQSAIRISANGLCSVSTPISSIWSKYLSPSITWPNTTCELKGKSIKNSLRDYLFYSEKYVQRYDLPLLCSFHAGHLKTKYWIDLNFNYLFKKLLLLKIKLTISYATRYKPRTKSETKQNWNFIFNTKLVRLRTNETQLILDLSSSSQ